MKTKYILGIVALSLGLASCENYFDKKYMDNGDPQISVVKTYDYTLTEADYVTIANNKTNKAYAESLDTIANRTPNQNALARVAEQHCFNETASADMYVPAFIYSKYPHLDPGSTFNVTYRTYDGLPAYIRMLNNTIRYTLSETDYAKIWGKEGIPYLSPSVVDKVTDVLPQIDDDMCVGVVYNYSSKEQDAGGKIEEQREVLYLFKDGMEWVKYSSETPLRIMPDNVNGQAINYLHNSYPYATENQIVALMNYNTKTSLYEATEYKFNGSEWVANTGIIEEVMSFVLASGWSANLSTYYKQAVAGEGNQGKLTTQEFDLEEGISYIWKFDNTYGMKGTAYYSGPHSGEGWFVTPTIKLKNSTSPALSFDHAINYGPLDGTLKDQVSVWVSTDYTDDVRTATWTQLPWNEFDGTTGLMDSFSWTFYNSGRMDLSAWNNQKIVIGFRYKSVAGQTCCTWEVKNILVNEPEEN
ncbi:MAG: hypothetical protein K6A36_07910 [Paludibacteraceae bacterium]|nr:hypothetical protein [Paludibacteraceae bacterium]